MKKSLWTLLMIVAAFTLVLAGCGTKEDTSSNGSTSDNDEGGKVYKVATEATFAPFESVDKEGNIVGIDVDVMQAIADEMKFDVEWQNIGWEPVFQSIKNSETDIGASGITINDERKAYL